MRRWIGLSFALIACGSSSGGGGPPSLVGNWIYIDSTNTAGAALDFKSDGTYVHAQLSLTSTTSADAQVETGTYTSTGTSFTATPKQWTCPGPDPVATLNYSFQNGQLVLSAPQGIITFQPNTSSGFMSSFQITNGCFDRTGTFTPSPLAPVSN
jgi:hypothetical protein